MSYKTLSILGLGLALLASGVRPAHAVDELNIVSGYTTAGAPLALHGHDPVALVNGQGSKKGTAKFTAVADGQSYYFVSQSNLDTFKAAPAKYEPQFGGYCAFGVSAGKKFDGDPDFAAVQDGKLYVFVNEDILRMFEKDKAGTLSKASANWTAIKSKSPASL